RFMSRDPMDYRDSLNPYAYVLSDPTGMTDPMGLGCLQFSRTNINVVLFAFNQNVWIGPVPVFIQGSVTITGTMFASTSTVCCPIGAVVQDQEVMVDVTATGYIGGGVGFGINQNWDGLRIFGYVGIRIGATVSGSFRGGGQTNKCAGVNNLQFTVCGRIDVVGIISGGGSVNIRKGWFNFQVAAEVFGTISTSTQACATWGAGGLQFNANGWTPWQLNAGVRVCFGGCFTWSIAGGVQPNQGGGGG